MIKSIPNSIAHTNSYCFLFYQFIFVVFFCLNISGCYHMKTVEQTIPDTDNLERGEKAFFQEQYSTAAAIFSSVLERNTNFVVKNAALYNLACTKLITSRDETDILKAVKMLDDWYPSEESNKHLENPLVLVKAFQQILNFNKKEHFKNIKEIKKKGALVEKQGGKIIELEKLIKKLQHQILELENIDQETQEKRKIN